MNNDVIIAGVGVIPFKKPGQSDSCAGQAELCQQIRGESGVRQVEGACVYCTST